MSSTSISETLSGIFAGLLVDRLPRRVSPIRFPSTTGGDDAVTSTPSQNENKRARIDRGDNSLLHTEIVRLVSEFLDPFELQRWSCCCKTTNEVCTLAMKLDQVFSSFRILRRHADRIHRLARYDWKRVLNVMLEALKVLQGVYGPYKVHPLHAAIVGEVLLISLEKYNCPTGSEISLRSLWRSVLAHHFVLGDYGDYFKGHDGYDVFRRVAKGSPERFAGPARILLEVGTMPFVHIFTSEAEEHTAQMGVSFTNVNSDANNDEVPVHVYCLGFQSLPVDDNDIDEQMEWYGEEGLVAANYRYNGDNTLGHAFCQHIPLFAGTGMLDEWTQLLRAGWLHAHKLTPFDGTDLGRMRWEAVIQSVGSDLKAGTSDKKDEFDEMEVLNFWDEGDKKDFAIFYVQQSHDMAKGSDYV